MSCNVELRDVADLFGQPIACKGRVRQLPLPLGWRREPGQSDEFLIGDSNAEAARHVAQPDDWTSPVTLLIGPAQSGRSKLAALFCAHGGGEVIDGLAGQDEDVLFHAWNRAQTSGKRLLIIADHTPSAQDIALPDLRTRLLATPVVSIGAPDACLTAALVDHLLADRGVAHVPQLGDYVAARIERSYAAIHAAVAAIDAAALAAGRAPGIRMARAALIEADLFDPSVDQQAAGDPA